MKHLSLSIVLVAAAVAGVPSVSADPVAVRFTEGVTRGFPVLRSTTGQKLAQGELVQVPRGDRIESRLVFRFHDGSYYEEQVTFSQQETFTLHSYRLIQRGPSFSESTDASIDRETERYTVRYKADEASQEEVVKGRFALPPDVYNGMLIMMIKNLTPGESQVVQIVAFTPRPRVVKMLLSPVAEDRVLVGDWPMSATRYVIKPQLGMFASLLVSDLPDVKCWVLGGDAPAFVRFEGPLYFMGPVWRIEVN